MANVDYGDGPNTPSGDYASTAFQKVEARLAAAEAAMSGGGGGGGGASLPTLAFGGAVSLAEGNSGTTVFGHPLTLTRNGYTAAVTVQWAVAGTGGNPATGDDFAGGALPSGTVVFAPGETAKTLAVLIAGDTTVEANENYTVTASMVLGTVTSLGTIQNDDSGGAPSPTPANTRANAQTVRANTDGFRQPLLTLQQRFAALGG